MVPRGIPPYCNLWCWKQNPECRGGKICPNRSHQMKQFVEKSASLNAVETEKKQ